MKRKIGVWVLTIFVIVLLITNGWITWKKEQIHMTTMVQEYQHPIKQDIKKVLTTKGVVIPSKSYEVLLQKEKGETYSVLVQEGEHVNQGDEIIQYENPELDAEIMALENKQMEYMNITDQLSNEIALLENDSIEVFSLDEENEESIVLESIQRQTELSDKKSELRLLSSQLESIEEDLEKLIRMKEQLVVKSPMEGIVTDIDEQVLQDGEQILSIKTNEPMLVKGKISELHMQAVTPELTAIMTMDALKGQKFEGIVTEVGRTPLKEPTIESQESEYPIYIQLNEVNENIVEGFHTTIDVILEQRKDVLTLPIEAIKKEDDQRYVYVLENGTLNKRLIKLGLQEKKRIEVKKGIKEDQLILEPKKHLKDGQKFFIPIQVQKLEINDLKQFQKEEIARILIKSVFK